MTTSELYEKTLKKPCSVTVRLTYIGAQCWDEGPDENMVADVVTFVPSKEDPDSSFEITLDFSPYRDYNEKVAKKDWYMPDSDQLGATWFTSGHYPKDGIVTGYISVQMSDEEPLDTFSIVEDASAYILDKKDSFRPVSNLQYAIDDFWKQMKFCHPEWTDNDLEKAKRTAHIRAYTFPQMWGSTALGFDRPGTIGCDAMTEAQTTILYLPQSDAAVVYLGSHYAYAVQPTNEVFWNDAHRWNMASISEAKTKY